MILKKLILKNIRSYIDEEINFSEGSLLLSGDIGAGKSTILYAIDFALFGTRRGEMSGSELLRNGKNQGSVELHFELDGKEIIIKRTLHRGRNISQEHGSITINSNSYEYMPTELKAKILDMLGYPQELIKKNIPIFRYTVYTPQDQMKSILFDAENRLEALRKIFNVDKYSRIRSNAFAFSKELRNYMKIQEEKIRYSSEKVSEKRSKQKQIEEIEKNLEESVRKIEFSESKIRKKVEEIENIKREINSFNLLSNEKARKETELRIRSHRLERISKDLQLIRDRTKSSMISLEKYKDLKAPQIKYEEIKNELAEEDRKRMALSREKAVISSEIQKLENIYSKGVCDFCGQSVMEKDRFKKKIDLLAESTQEIDRRLKLCEDFIKKFSDIDQEWRKYSLESEKKKSLERIIESEKNNESLLNKEKIEIEIEIKEINQEINELLKDLSILQHSNEQHKILEKELAELNNEILLTEKLRSRLEQQHEDIHKEIIRLEKDIEEINLIKERIEKTSKLEKWTDDFFTNLMENIERHVMAALQKEFNSFFEKWFSILMPDDNLSVRINEDFTPVIDQNGFETEYQNLSGGEKTSVALAYRLALNMVINSMIESIKTKDLIILDEPTDGFSNEQLDKLRDVINELNLRQIIIVSHDPKIDTFVDNVIRLHKDNHISKVVA